MDNLTPEQIRERLLSTNAAADVPHGQLWDYARVVIADWAAPEDPANPFHRLLQRLFGEELSGTEAHRHLTRIEAETLVLQVLECMRDATNRERERTDAALKALDERVQEAWRAARHAQH